MYRCFALILLLCFTAMLQSKASAQNVGNTINRLSTEEGLSQASISGIVQDKHGYVWIGTQLGLNRYDGNNITLVKSQFNLATKHISYITLVDPDLLLVSTAFSGAYLVNINTLEVEQVYSGRLVTNSNAFSEITAAFKIGNMLYAGIDNFLYKIDLNSKRSTLVTSFEKHSYIRALLRLDKVLLIGTNQGFFSYNFESLQLIEQQFLPEQQRNSLNSNVKLLKIDPAIGLLVGTVQGLFSIPINNKTLQLESAYTLVPELNIWDHVITPYGELIATERGVYTIDRKRQTASKLLSLKESQFALAQSNVIDLMFDTYGNIWMATLNQGAYYWPLTSLRFKTLKAENKAFINHNIWSIYEQNENQIWVGTDNGLLMFKGLHDTNPKHYYKNTDPKAAYATNAIYKTIALNHIDNNVLFVETLSGLRMLNKSDDTVHLPPVETPQKNPFLSLNWGASVVSKNEIAFISSEGFFVYDALNKSVRSLVDLTQQLDVDSAYKFLPPLPSRQGEYVLSTERYLVSYNERTGKLTTIYEFNKQDAERFSVIDHWVYTEDGTLWLASSVDGLIALDEQSLALKYTLKITDGSEPQSAYQLIPDNFGYLWISSQSGLYRLNISNRQLQKFDASHGLPNSEFNAGASTTLESGVLAFGTINGVVWFSPTDFLENNTSRTELAITDISLMSRSIDFYPTFLEAQPLVLNHDDLGLKVMFSNFDFSNQLIYHYRANLTGPTSIEFSNLNSNYLFFNHLKPGEYTLLIEQLALGNQQVNDAITLSFKVEHSLFNSPLAWAVYILSVMSMVLIWLKQNNKKQRTIKAALSEMTISKQQTEMALNTTRSGIWQVNLAAKTVKQRRNFDCLPISSDTEVATLNDYFELIHPDDQEHVQRVWKQFISSPTDKQLSLTYRVKGINEPWLWYHDIGQVQSFDEKGKVKDIMGIYTNITEQKATDLRATILGEAFSQVSDWILILDADLHPLSVNASFCHAFELDENYAVKELSFKKFTKVVGYKKLNNLLKRIQKLGPNHHIRQELTVKTSHQDAHPIHLSINAISKDNRQIEHYVIVISDLTEQKQAESELRYLANFDALTKLPNRNLMLQHIEFALHNAQSSERNCALLFIDLDKFKPINDAYGHHTGDQLLIKITERISDILPGNCVLGRQSGDEFIVLVKDVRSPHKLSELATKLLDCLPNKIEIGGITMSISASIGVAMYPFDAQTPEMLIRNADIAMIHAKQAGRNGFKFFTTQMNTQFSRKLTLENALKTAYRDEQIYNHYQPIVNIISGRVVGVELLMRWEYEGENVSPIDFIPISEEVGLIELMTEQALKRALRELREFIENDSEFYLSLNLSAVHILKSDIAQNLVNILNSFNLNTSVLRLEITESSLMEDTDKAKRSLIALKRAGFVLLLDDFGTGYSSLTYLNQFPIDIIKIDQGFVRKMDSLNSNKSIIRTIYLLAESLQMSCIAEGVENTEQLVFLKELGCHYMQGYYFSKPVSAEDLAKIIEQAL
ncbi:EAL domain-containing protein [Pseudoalteromonas sp. T1lg23B]|uniref:EAL domain-containing protein n=1 Tax=Pseudoalteromonas sp. T1lg23B TaxID=2077097 RepID=UPI000CF67DD8|nr:EAL domain-containing protein [Pseudoalteromonas sp. T1lg23B]